MDANGFSWVHHGAGGSRGTQTKQAEAKMVLHNMFTSPMAGEISPDMMFFGVCQKCSNVDVEG